jgi:hypothetical protein
LGWTGNDKNKKKKKKKKKTLLVYQYHIIAIFFFHKTDTDTFHLQFVALGVQDYLSLVF